MSAEPERGQRRTISFAAAQVAALLVRLSALRDLHHKRCLCCCKVVQQLEVQRGTQIVRVRDENILDALLNELVEYARAKKSGVDVTVAGGAPARGFDADAGGHGRRLGPGRRREQDRYPDLSRSPEPGDHRGRRGLNSSWNRKCEG